LKEGVMEMFLEKKREECGVRVLAVVVER